MTLHFNKKQAATILSVFIITALILLFLYFKYYQPAVQQLEMKKTELHSDEKGLAMLQQKVNQMGEKTFESTIALQKKVPVKPLTDQLLLQLDKAETVSGSTIKSINFLTGEAAKGQAETTLEDSNETQSNQNSKKTVALPTGVKSTTVTIAVESPSYFELEEFIKQLQSLARIIGIEKIDVNGPTEMTTDDQEKQTIAVTITASAFYMPELQSLADQLPKLEVPSASDKLNPFVQFPDTQQNNDQTP